MSKRMKRLSQANKVVVMIGTSPDTKGGIAAVVDSYRKGGLFERWPIVYISTHADGVFLLKVGLTIKALMQFLRLLIMRRVSFIHVLSASNASFWRKVLFINLAFLARRPVIFHLHGGRFSEFYTRCDPLRKSLIRVVLNRVDHIIVLSNSWRMAIASLTINKHVTCIPNAVFDNHETRVEEKCRDYGKGQFLYLGIIQEEKGVFDLIKAFAQIIKQFPRAKLVIAGEGRIHELLLEAETLGIADAVRCPGWVSGEVKQQLLTCSDALVLPSYAEGLPMVILEAMAAGLPVISSKVGGIPDVVEHGVEGMLMEPGDVSKLAAAMRQLLSDGELRISMGKAARAKTLTHFSLQKVVCALEELYRSVVDDNAKR